MNRIIAEKQIVVKDGYSYNLTYSLFEKHHTIDYIGEIVSYGLQIRMNVDGNPKRKEDFVVANISTQRNNAEKLFDKITQHEVFPVHLTDVISDLL